MSRDLCDTILASSIKHSASIRHPAFSLQHLANVKHPASSIAIHDVTMLRCYENNSRAYSQSHELCLEEWENGQRANSCCYRSHSAIIWGLSRIYRSDASRRVESGLSPVSNRQVTSRGDIYGARKVGQGFSLAHLRVPWQVSSKINGSKVQCITTR